MEAIERILASDVGQVFAMKLDPARRAAFGIEDAVSPLRSDAFAASEGVTSRRQAALRADTSDAAGLREATAARIARCVAHAIHVSPADIDRSKSFSDYGVDSIVGVKLINTINDEFDVVLRTTVLFDYASIEDLARYLESHHGHQLSREPPAATSTTTRDANAGSDTARATNDVLRAYSPIFGDSPDRAPEANGSKPKNGRSELSLLELLARGELTVEQAFNRWSGGDHAE
jgi:acyl carrier protein